MTDDEANKLWEEIYQAQVGMWYTFPPTVEKCNIHTDTHGYDHDWVNVNAEAHAWSMVLTGSPAEGDYVQCLNCRMMMRTDSSNSWSNQVVGSVPFGKSAEKSRRGHPIDTSSRSLSAQTSSPTSRHRARGIGIIDWLEVKFFSWLGKKLGIHYRGR